MIRLIRAEFARFWGRRIVWVSVGLACLAILAAFAISYTQTSADEPSNEAGIEQAEAATRECVAFFTGLPDDQLEREFPELADLEPAEFDDELRRNYCFNDPSWFGAGDKRFFATSLLTESFSTGEIDDWSEDRLDSSRVNTFNLGSDTIRQAQDGLLGILPAIATFALVLSVVIGGSFVGAEYRAGTVENLLLWEPRRGRVLGAKFVAGFVSSVVVTSIVLAWLAALFYLLAILRGTTQGVDSRFWIDIVSVILRAGIVGGFFFVIAMAVAVIARNTTASVGLVLGWFAISNILIELVAKGFRRWELFTNALAFISEANVPKYQRVQGGWDTVFAHSYLTGGLVALLWAAALAGLATWVFVRRDVD